VLRRKELKREYVYTVERETNVCVWKMFIGAEKRKKGGLGEWHSTIGARSIKTK